MKVFKMNDFDYVAANTKKEAIRFYGDNEYDDVTNRVEEIRLDKAYMWHGYNIGGKLDKKINRLNRNYRKFKSGRYYEIKVDPLGDFDLVVRLTYLEVLKWEKIKWACIISTTEV